MLQAEQSITPTFRFKVTDYADGVGELVFWYDEPIGREERREAQLYPGVRQPREKNELDETNIERAIRRAKSKMRKLVMTMRADRMLTLTTRSAEDYQAMSKYLVRFIKAVHEVYPDWKYVAVAEKHDSEKTSAAKRGSYHWHLAVSGFQDVGFLRTTWRAIVGEGNIDVTSPKTGGDKKAGSASIAGYLTKYLAKTFRDSEQNRHRYRASKGLELRQIVGWLGSTSWRDAINEAEDIMQRVFGQVGGFFPVKEFECAWMCSWWLGDGKPRRFRTSSSRAHCTTS